MASPGSAAPRLRRTRFVCISDTHNCTVKLPKGDVLLHAGDLTNQGSYSELTRAVQWLEKADFEAKLVIAGNHDVTLDKDFYQEFGSYFHNQAPQTPEDCLAVLKSSPSITYLDHESVTIRLTHQDGPKTTFTVFGSPYSPRNGRWAFNYDGDDQSSLSSTDRQQSANVSRSRLAKNIWSSIPLDTDILLTHTPSYTHRDESTRRRRAMGCEDLRRALWRVRPRLAVCGHVHEGRGAERVRWDIDGGSSATYMEAGVETWDDPGGGPGNTRLSLVDLTGRGERRALENDGSSSSSGRPGSSHANEAKADPEHGGDTALPGSGTRGMGGDPETSMRCDRTALYKRMGRRETCIVNCAIVATNFPHAGGKRFNKPIVVDLDLPVWESYDDESTQP